MYVLGVGVAGGMTLGARRSQAGLAALPRSSCWQAGYRGVVAARDAASALPIAAKLLGGLATAAVIAGGIQLSLNYFRVPPVDTPLAREARSIMAALKAYHAARGAYPVSYSPIIDIKKDLVRDGYLSAAPGEVSTIDPGARYLSVNGKSYGLQFHIDRSDDYPSGTCLVEVGRSYIGWGERSPECPF